MEITFTNKKVFKVTDFNNYETFIIAENLQEAVEKYIENSKHPKNADTIKKIEFISEALII